MKLLIAEHDKNVCETLKKALERSNYTVDIANDYEEAATYAESIPYDTVIIDNDIPGGNGLEAVRNMRKAKLEFPVLILSSKSDTDDKVNGLDCGADDYLTKPFAIAEFMARVRALLRRSSFSYTDNKITFGNLTLDCSGYVLYTEHGSLNMNNKEFQITENFMRNPGRIYSTEELMAHFWGYESDSAINVVWTNIANIRYKLKTLKADVMIDSIRGVGYKLEKR